MICVSLAAHTHSCCDFWLVTLSMSLGSVDWVFRGAVSTHLVMACKNNQFSSSLLASVHGKKSFHLVCSLKQSPVSFLWSKLYGVWWLDWKCMVLWSSYSIYKYRVCTNVSTKKGCFWWNRILCVGKEFSAEWAMTSVSPVPLRKLDVDYKGIEELATRNERKYFSLVKERK